MPLQDTALGHSSEATQKQPHLRRVSMEETHKAKTHGLLNELSTDISSSQEICCKTNNELRDMLEQILSDTASSALQLKLESLIRKFQKHLLLIFDNNEYVLMSPKSTRGNKEVMMNAEKIICTTTTNRKTQMEFNRLRAVAGVEEQEEDGMVVLTGTL